LAVFAGDGPISVVKSMASRGIGLMGVLLANDGFSRVLRQLTATRIAAIEGSCIPGQQPVHQNASASRPAAKQKIVMVA
jgi:hypothetical protein